MKKKTKATGRQMRIEKKTPPTSEAAEQTQALGRVMDVTPDGLGDTFDQLRLLGAVVGQITALDVATSSTAEDSDRMAAARLLTKLDEKPDAIADRLRSSQFSRLSTAGLEHLIAEVKRGKSPELALVAAMDKEASA